MSRDIDRSMRYFIDAWGVGPWYVLRRVKSAMLYQDEPRELEVSIAMANCGDLQFEIVAQHNDEPSLYQDALADTPELHVQHVSILKEDVVDTENDAYAKGWESVFETLSGPGRSVFIAHPDAPKVCIEISDCDPFKVRVREAIKQFALTWDRTNPVREGLPQ
jgi:hypothetical protein